MYVCMCVYIYIHVYIWKNENSNMKRYVHLSVHKSTISNHKGMETTHTSINRGLPKRMGCVCVCVCVYIHTMAYYLSIKNEILLVRTVFLVK